MNSSDIADRHAVGIPRVWVGCVACYREGRLVGCWCDEADAGLVSSRQLHQGMDGTMAHLELYGFDVEDITIDHGLSVRDATLWGRALLMVDPCLRAAFLAWTDATDRADDPSMLLDATADFVDAYCGVWQSFDCYALHLAEDDGLIDTMPEESRPSVDWDLWIRDLSHDYVTCPAPGGMYVFRSL